MYNHFFKRVLDFISSLTGFLILLPLFLIITVVLYFVNEGKPFFLQSRPGKNEKIFSILKFKTMNDKKDAHGKLLPDPIRTTKAGRFIRKYSLDEIPQLINVIIGDMSVIGPRPLLKSYLGLYSKEQRQRHNVKPGITGWAQVNGRSALTWDQKFAFDLWYVKNISFKTDLIILIKTISKLFKGDGVSKKGEKTAGIFKGSSEE